jgi:hypothetical protein
MILAVKLGCLYSDTCVLVVHFTVTFFVHEIPSYVDSGVSCLAGFWRESRWKMLLNSDEILPCLQNACEDHYTLELFQ